MAKIEFILSVIFVVLASSMDDISILLQSERASIVDTIRSYETSILSSFHNFKSRDYPSLEVTKQRVEAHNRLIQKHESAAKALVAYVKNKDYSEISRCYELGKNIGELLSPASQEMFHCNVPISMDLRLTESLTSIARNAKSQLEKIKIDARQCHRNVRDNYFKILAIKCIRKTAISSAITSSRCQIQMEMEYQKLRRLNGAFYPNLECVTRADADFHLSTERESAKMEQCFDS